MKRIICLLLSVMLMCSALALADELFRPAEGTEQKLARMLPVLDSLADALGVTGAGEDYSFYAKYDVNDAGLVWNQLRGISLNWLAQDAQYQAANGLRVPESVLQACAAASFDGLTALPAVPAAGQTAQITYDAVRRVYIIPLADAGRDYAVIERYAADGDAIVVNCGVYAPDGAYAKGDRLGGLTARLEPNEAVRADPAFPYIVTDARAEASDDFNGLWVSVCDIRREAYEALRPAATTVPAPTVAPTAEPVSYTALSSGSRGDAVRALQNRLNALGYNCGRADGVFGKATKRAVRYFQDALGVKQDGVAGAKVQEKLFAAGAPRFRPYVNLKKGSGGIRVEDLQERLRALGYTAQPVDGSFGERTLAAVRRFQKAAGLKEDGVAGAKTLKALEKKDAPKCPGYIDLAKGDTGSRVTELQNRLIALDFLTGKASGKYDEATVKAVKAYMDANGVSGDGKAVSAQLIEAMFKPVPTPTPEPDAPSDQPADEPTDAPTDTPADNPADDSKADPGDKPSGDLADEPADKPADDPADKPAEDPADKPAVNPADDSSGGETQPETPEARAEGE